MNSQSLPEYTIAFGLGPLEIGAVLIIVLVLFGPKRLPGLGKSMGEAIKGFKKGIGEDNSEIDVTDSIKQEKIKDAEKE